MFMKKFIVAWLLAFATVIPAFADEIPDSVFDADPYFLLMGEADAAIADKNWPEAAARLCDALAVKPNHPSNALLFNNLASVYSRMGEDSLAVATYGRGLEIAPNMLTLVVGRGKTYLALGRDKEAYGDFCHAVEIDSIAADARFYRGMMALYSGNLATAEADFKVLNTVAPKSIDNAVAMSTLYSLTNRERQAIPYLEKLIENEPAAEYYATLAGCRLALGELTEASEVISAGLKRYPRDPELYYYRAWLNRDRFRNDDARADGARAIELGANPQKVKELLAGKH